MVNNLECQEPLSGLHSVVHPMGEVMLEPRPKFPRALACMLQRIGFYFLLSLQLFFPFSSASFFNVSLIADYVAVS